MLDRISQKFTSGKWVLTMAAAIVFVVASLKGMLEKETVSVVVTMVFTLYFTRKNNDKPV